MGTRLRRKVAREKPSEYGWLDLSKLSELRLAEPVLLSVDP